MVGSKRGNCIVVVFMGSQPAGSERNVWSCSSGGLGQNMRWKRGLAYCTMEVTALCSTGHVRNGVLLMGRGLAYRKTDETDLCWSAKVETGILFCSDPTSDGQVSVLPCHPWIGNADTHST